LIPISPVSFEALSQCFLFLFLIESQILSDDNADDANTDDADNSTTKTTTTTPKSAPTTT